MPSPQLREFLGEASTAYAEQLKSDSDAQDYLTNTRNLSADKQAYFRLGSVVDPLPGHEKYAGTISIPYLTRTGVVGMKFRNLNPDAKAKYLNLPKQPVRLFNPEALFSPKPYIAICEGEMDTMTAHGRMLPAIGVPGVDGWQAWFDRPLTGYDAVYVLADNDDAGQGMKFAEFVAERLENVRVVPMPKGHDVNSFVAAEGYSALLNKIGIEA